jgi:hypothetical protein
MSGFEQLERQLLESVAERSRPRRFERLVGVPLRWRGRFGQGAFVLAVSLIVVVALAVGASPTRPEGASSASRLSASVLEETCSPCQAFGGRLHSGSRAATVAAGPAHAPDRRGLSAVRWSEEELAADAGASTANAD